jgi:hypothetical protein
MSSELVPSMLGMQLLFYVVEHLVASRSANDFSWSPSLFVLSALACSILGAAKLCCALSQWSSLLCKFIDR